MQCAVGLKQANSVHNRQSLKRKRLFSAVAIRYVARTVNRTIIYLLTGIKHVG